MAWRFVAADRRDHAPHGWGGLLALFTAGLASAAGLATDGRRRLNVPEFQESSQPITVRLRELALETLLQIGFSRASQLSAPE